MNRKIGLLAGVAAAGLLTVAAGLYSNNFPQVLPQNSNSVVMPAPSNGLQINPGIMMTPPVPTNCCGPYLAVDTNNQGGAAPATVAATPFQVAATVLEANLNTQTSTVHAATSNTLGGVIVTESLSTAAGASYTFTLTNSLITAAYAAAGKIPQVAIYSISNTGGLPTYTGAVTSASTGNQSTASVPGTSAAMTLVSETDAVGSVVFVWRNDGATALNGTMYIAWHL